LAPATNSSLSLTNIGTNQFGGYSVVVASAYGSVTSAVAMLTLIVPPTNGDFFVSPTGNDNNPGTLSQPFYTIAKAISVAAPGSLIYVRGGAYPYSDTIRIETGGTAANRSKL